MFDVCIHDYVRSMVHHVYILYNMMKLLNYAKQIIHSSI